MAPPFVLALLMALTAYPAASDRAPSPGSTMPPPGVALADPQSEAVALKQEALTVASQVAAAYPDDALSAALLGSAYFNTGRSIDAGMHLRRCLELNPALVDAYEILARMAYERGEPEESARLCRKALEQGPPNFEILMRLGRSLVDLGETDEAIAHLRRATGFPQATAESHYLLGQALLQSGKPADAKTAFLAAVGAVPDHTQAVFGLFTASQRLGQEEDARRFRERFQSLEAKDRLALDDRNADEQTLSGLPLVRKTVAQTLFGAAQVHRARQHEEAAGPLLFRAALLDPDPPAYRAALETHFLRRQALAEGIAAFEKLASAQPTQPFNPLFLGRLHHRLQHLDAAEQCFRKVQTLAPDWPEGYRALAELYLRSGRRTAEAVTLARKAVDLAPTATHFHLLAAVCAENHDRPGALEAIQRAIALEPGQSKYREFQKKLQATP